MILLNPGPVNVSDRVREALLRPDICHREEEFSHLQTGIRQKVLKAFSPPKGYTVVLLTGSGTSAVEAALSSSMDTGERLLVINNGVYGERMTQMASAYGLDWVELKTSCRELPDLNQLEEVLSKDSSIRMVAMVHHETTVGLINPVQEIATLTQASGRRLLVDSVSGLGGEPLDLSEAAVDLCIGTAGKCIQGYPGVSFVLLRDDEAQRQKKISPRSLYLNLSLHLAEQEKGSTPFTPAVQVYYAFDEALEELLQEGLNARILRYRDSAQVLRKGFEALGLALYLPDACRSNSITSIGLPRDMSYEALHESLKHRGYVIYAGQGALRNTLFRVANMGALKRSDFEGFLRHFEEILGSISR